MPKSVRQVTYGASQLKNPVQAAVYHGIERPLTSNRRGGKRKSSRTAAPVYRHDGCAVNHRSAEAAQRCRNGSAPAAVTGSAPTGRLPAAPVAYASQAEAPRVPSTLTKAELRSQSVTDMTWILQQPEFESSHLQETLPELEGLIDQGEFGAAAELIVDVHLLSGGNTKEVADDFADLCANTRRRLCEMQGRSDGEAEVSGRSKQGHAPLRMQVDELAVTDWVGQVTPDVPVYPAGDVAHPPKATAESPQGSARLTVEELVRRADSFTPNLSTVDELAYFDYQRGAPLPLELRAVANEIALDWDCDGGADHPAARQRLAQLSASDAQSVSAVASRVWYQAVYSAMEPLAQRLALHLAEDPDFDPLPWGEWLDDFVDGRLHGHRPALISITRRALFDTAERSGEVERNEAEVKRNAQAALESMGPLERDVYGFASRNERRRQLALDHLTDIRPTRHGLMIYWMSRFEGEQFGAQREARFATASRRLADLGESRAAVSRLLGISTSVLDRIERENRSDVDLAWDDPIVVHLAPQLMT